MESKLNLGCGFDLREGYHNVDNAGTCDEVVDLMQYPWPWADGSFSEIVAQDIVEHLPNTVEFINECWRVMAPSGKLIIRTPKADAPFLWIDPTHLRGYELESFHFFDPNTDFGRANNHLTPRKWSIFKEEVVNHNCCVEMVKVKA